MMSIYYSYEKSTVNKLFYNYKNILELFFKGGKLRQSLLVADEY